MSEMIMEKFSEMNECELNSVDGGAIGIGVACAIAAATSIHCAWYGFVAGCAYELVFGE